MTRQPGYRTMPFHLLLKYGKMKKTTPEMCSCVSSICKDLDQKEKKNYLMDIRNKVRERMHSSESKRIKDLKMVFIHPVSRLIRIKCMDRILQLSCFETNQMLG